MKGLIFNLGKKGGRLITSNRYKIKYIPENDTILRKVYGMSHRDPDLFHWTFSDYPDKQSKVHLGDLKIGDYIFFNTTLYDNSATGNQKYFIAYLHICERVNIKDIKNLWKEPYCYNSHIQRALYGNGESPSCEIFVGDPKTSRIIRNPIPFNRTLVSGFFDRFDNENNAKEKSLYNWYYNKPQFPNVLGIQKYQSGKKKGNIISDTSLISSKFRQPPLLPSEICDYLIELMNEREVLPTNELQNYGFMHNPLHPDYLFYRHNLYREDWEDMPFNTKDAT